jgi:hypothetical protein
MNAYVRPDEVAKVGAGVGALVGVRESGGLLVVEIGVDGLMGLVGDGVESSAHNGTGPGRPGAHKQG